MTGEMGVDEQGNIVDGKPEVDVTGWRTVHKERTPEGSTIYTQFLRHGPHYLYRALTVDANGNPREICPLGAIHDDLRPL